MIRFKSLAFGLAALLAVTAAGGMVYAHDKKDDDRGPHADPHAMGEHKPGHHSHGKHAKGSGCKKHGPKHGMRGDMRGPHHFRPDPNRMARELSTMETAIGIRAEQLDTWRDFTDALQALMPKPPHRDGKWTKLDDEPFWMAEKFADKTLEKAEAAKQLKEAVAKLRETLTPEQLERAKGFEDGIRDRMRHHRWGDRGGKGPSEMRGHGDKWKHQERYGDRDRGGMMGDTMDSDEDKEPMSPSNEEETMTAPNQDAGDDADTETAPDERDEL